MTNLIHHCTSDCNETKDCPICPHGKQEDEPCAECDARMPKMIADEYGSLFGRYGVDDIEERKYSEKYSELLKK